MEVYSVNLRFTFFKFNTQTGKQDHSLPKRGIWTRGEGDLVESGRLGRRAGDKSHGSCGRLEKLYLHHDKVLSLLQTP